MILLNSGFVGNFFWNNYLQRNKFFPFEKIKKSNRNAFLIKHGASTILYLRYFNFTFFIFTHIGNMKLAIHFAHITFQEKELPFSILIFFQTLNRVPMNVLPQWKSLLKNIKLKTFFGFVFYVPLC